MKLIVKITGKRYSVDDVLQAIDVVGEIEILEENDLLISCSKETFKRLFDLFKHTEEVTFEVTEE